MASEALQSLAEIKVRSLLDDHPSSGVSELIRLHKECENANLLSLPASDEAERLYGLFNVAIEHGLSCFISNYVTLICFGPGFSNQNHPSSLILSDPNCVIAWLESSCLAARHDLSSGVGQSRLHSSQLIQIASRYVAKLQVVTMVSEYLASQPLQGVGSRLSARRGTQGPIPTATSTVKKTTDNKTPSIALLEEEARRLLQTAQVVQWISSHTFLYSRPSGRFESQAAWKTAVECRRSQCLSSPTVQTLFLTDLLNELAQYDMDPIEYPPSSPESFLSSLFFSGSSNKDAFLSKLAVYTYGILDGGFLTANDMAQSLRRSFSIENSKSLVWMVSLFLDDAYAGVVDQEADDRNAAALTQAELLLSHGMDTSTIPYRALRVFLEKGRPGVALSLLRQRNSSSGDNSNSTNNRDDAIKGAMKNAADACTVLRILLENDLLIESFIELKRHLQSVQLESQRKQHAQKLIDELLSWGAQSYNLDALVRLPLGPASQEELALIRWMEESCTTHTLPEAGIMLTLYYLMRGRTPEAMVSYATYGRHERCCHSNVQKEQVECLLRAAARMLPSAQRALVVGKAPVPRLVQQRDGESENNNMVVDSDVVALASAIPGIEGSLDLPPLLSLGPSLLEAPLVAGIISSFKDTKTATKSVAVQSDKDVMRTVKGAQNTSTSYLGASTPLLFTGQQKQAVPSTLLHSEVQKQRGTSIGYDLFGPGIGDLVSSAPVGSQQHKLDTLLGLGGKPQTGTKTRRGMR